MSLLAYSPLGGGMCRASTSAAPSRPGARFTAYDSFRVRFRRPLVAEAVEAYAKVAKGAACRCAARTRYVKSRWFLGASIVGATSLAQLREDIAAAQFALDADTLAAIAAVQLRYPKSSGLKRPASASSANREIASHFFAVVIQLL
jgi:aryl-alcohol dehydrogenase-like predicted oxidoreductase